MYTSGNFTSRAFFRDDLQMKTFGERLLARAQELGLSQRALARAAGISHTHVSKLIDNSRGVAPSYPLVIRLSDVLGVPDRWLYWGDDYAAEHDSEHNKHLAISLARAGAINEGVLSTVSKEKVESLSQPSVLWWIDRILTVNAYLKLPRPTAPRIRLEEPVDNVTSRGETQAVMTKGFLAFTEQAKQRGAKARIAKLLGVRPATVSQIIKRRSCGLKLAARIEATLKIPAVWWDEMAEEAR